MKLFNLLFLSFSFLLFAIHVTAQEPKNTGNLSSGIQLPKPVKKPELRDELLKRLATARDARTKLIKKYNGSIPAAEFSAITKIDDENVAWIKSAVEKYGWLGISLVGEDGENAAFRMIRNASQDAEFQKHCLELMKEAVKDGEATAEQIEALTERIGASGGQPAAVPTRTRKTMNVTTVNPDSSKPTSEVENPQLRDEILEKVKSD